MPRDPRFIAVHRGGLLNPQDHRLLATWAADCAERVLRLFSAELPEDDRPLVALETARRWVRGEVPVGAAQKASVAAHAAARTAQGLAARKAARAAGQAVATAHMADHALGGAAYAIRALRAAGADEATINQEREWQKAQLPESTRELVLSAQKKLPEGWK